MRSLQEAVACIPVAHYSQQLSSTYWPPFCLYDADALALRLDGSCRTPQCPTGIHSIRIQFEHPVVKLLSGFGFIHQTVEVSDVLTRLFNNPRVVFVLWAFVGRDHCTWVERFDLVECGYPLLSLLRVRLTKIEMNVVVGGIAGNHKPD